MHPPGMGGPSARVAESLFNISINGTSMGLKPGDELPFPPSVVERFSQVAECVIARK